MSVPCAWLGYMKLEDLLTLLFLGDSPTYICISAVFLSPPPQPTPPPPPHTPAHQTTTTSVLQLDLASMGPLKTLPYLVMFLMSNAGGWTGDALILQQHRSVAAARKTVNTLGAW